MDVPEPVASEDSGSDSDNASDTEVKQLVYDTIPDIEEYVIKSSA